MQGQVAISYKIFRAWVSDYQAVPELDAHMMNAVGIQSITLQHEGWERDTSVPEPVET
jgi:phage tail-like protein